MKHFVLDNTVCMSWCFRDEASGHTDSFLYELRKDAIAFVPCLWRYELANCLVMATNKKRITQEESERFIDDLQSLPIRLDLFTLENAYSGKIYTLSRKHSLTAYDAAYLELAMRLDLPLVTLDMELIKAAKDSGVTLL